MIETGNRKTLKLNPVAAHRISPRRLCSVVRLSLKS
jgi:hypothetical protein